MRTHVYIVYTICDMCIKMYVRMHVNQTQELIYLKMETTSWFFAYAFERETLS